MAIGPSQLISLGKEALPRQARMVGLCLGVEHLVGLVQLLDSHRQQVSGAPGGAGPAPGQSQTAGQWSTWWGWSSSWTVTDSR